MTNNRALEILQRVRPITCRTPGEADIQSAFDAAERALKQIDILESELKATSHEYKLLAVKYKKLESMLNTAEAISETYKNHGKEVDELLHSYRKLVSSQTDLIMSLYKAAYEVDEEKA